MGCSFCSGACIVFLFNYFALSLITRAGTQWGAVRPSVPHLFSPSILSFVLSLALIEGLLLWYWVELRLGHILLYGSGAAALAALTGKQALVGIAARRTSSRK